MPKIYSGQLIEGFLAAAPDAGGGEPAFMVCLKGEAYAVMPRKTAEDLGAKLPDTPLEHGFEVIGLIVSPRAWE